MIEAKCVSQVRQHWETLREYSNSVIENIEVNRKAIFWTFLEKFE